MSDRIRQLEDALAILQSTLTREPHPLLTRELLNIKSSLELHSAVDSEVIAESREEDAEDSYIDAFGTLAVRDDGAATFYGRSAGSEVRFLSFRTLLGFSANYPRVGRRSRRPLLQRRVRRNCGGAEQGRTRFDTDCIIRSPQSLLIVCTFSICFLDQC
jgi:hypothetical protein